MVKRNRDDQIKTDYGVEALRSVAKTPEGRRALKFILELTPFYENTFTGDPYKDAFYNGQRHIALILRSFFDKEILIKIEQEDLCQKQ